jgi:hypothetical protein
MRDIKRYRDKKIKKERKKQNPKEKIGTMRRKRNLPCDLCVAEVSLNRSRLLFILAFNIEELKCLCVGVCVKESGRQKEREREGGARQKTSAKPK